LGKQAPPFTFLYIQIYHIVILPALAPLAHKSDLEAQRAFNT
jgi:hypothetical protein